MVRSLKKIFITLKVHKVNDEFIWLEYIQFLKININIIRAKKYLIDMEDIPLKTFVNQNPDFEGEISAFNREIQQSMIKQMFAVMTMGWFNSKWV